MRMIMIVALFHLAFVLANGELPLFAQSLFPQGVANSNRFVQAMNSANAEAKNGLSRARKNLAQAKGEQARAEALKQVREAVAHYFDEDMKRRERELTQIRERIINMESRLKKRVTAKREILELQLKLLTFEADGLGLFATDLATVRGSYPLNPSWAPGRQMTQPTNSVAYPQPTWPESAVVAGQPSLRPLGQSEFSEVRKNLRRLRKKLADVVDQGERDLIGEELMTSMTAYFEADMKLREAELTGIKKRVDDMEQHLNKRAAAKQEIVDLQVRMFEKEAEGLGFFDCKCHYLI